MFKIVGIGDSSLTGLGTTGYVPDRGAHGEYQSTYSGWWSQLVRNNPDWEFKNLGRNHALVSDLTPAGRFERQANFTSELDEDTDLAIVMIGGNDFIQNTDPLSFKLKLNEVMHLIESVTDAHIMFVSIWETGYKQVESPRRFEWDEYRKPIMDMERWAWVSTLDLSKVFHPSFEHPEIGLFKKDEWGRRGLSLHLSDAGNWVLAREMQAAISMLRVGAKV